MIEAPFSTRQHPLVNTPLSVLKSKTNECSSSGARAHWVQLSISLMCSASGSVGSAFVSQPLGCEFESRSSHFSFLLLAREIMHMPVNTAVRAVVRSPIGVLCLRVGTFTFLNDILAVSRNLCKVSTQNIKKSHPPKNASVLSSNEI